MPVYHFLLGNTGFFFLALVLFALLVGSFLNVVIARLPVMMQRQWRRECCELLQQDEPTDTEPFSIVRPRSRCPRCGTPIRAWDNIPILSFLLLRGRCRACRERISLRYPTIEFLAAALAVCAGLRFGITPQTLAALVLSWCLLCLAMIDLEHLLLPDTITLPLLWLGLINNIFGLFTNIHASLFGAILGYLGLWSVATLFKMLTGREGMGHGDFKLLAALGAWLGWQLLPAIILLASLAGSAVGLGMILAGRSARDVPIPFGPYLALGGWCGLIWGGQIMRFWLG